jgi:hypothetical protein
MADWKLPAMLSVPSRGTSGRELEGSAVWRLDTASRMVMVIVRDNGRLSGWNSSGRLVAINRL